MLLNFRRPEPMKRTGDLSSNWVNFQAEVEDFLLAPGLKEKEVQATILRKLMGNKCRHVYKYNLGLMKSQQKDMTAIM